MIRGLALGAVLAGIAVPLVRRRLGLHPAVTAVTAAAAPFGMAIAAPRSRKRDVAVYALQMWAYIVIHELPYEDPRKLERRVLVDYPIAFDRWVFGTEPGVALQGSLSQPGRASRLDQALTAVHWAWFVQPHAVAVWILWRRPERFARSAVMIGSVYDLGAIAYFAAPTAPPWWAAEQGRIEGLRRIMAEVGERFWGRLWGPLYDFLGSNPLAAMPSTHFATSVMAAHLLAEVGPTEGAVGWSYASTLGFALVYLGEHYVADLLAGLALVELVRYVGPGAAPALRGVSRAIGALEARAVA